MKKLILISIIILTLCLDIPNPSGRNISKDSIDDLEILNTPLENISFNLKMNTMMKLAHLRSISACIVKNNTLVWSKGYGFSDKLILQRPSKGTVYLVGSITKVLTATALMQLYENDSYDLNLDDNVSKWLPFDLKNPNYPNTNITLRMLLAHQSSLRDHEVQTLELISDIPYSFVEEMLVPGYERYNPDYWADYSPGDDAYYSNLGFIILGYIIERMTNVSYEQYCKENILKPLEMNNSGFNISNMNKFNIAAPYSWICGLFIRGYKLDYSFGYPCGGLFTSSEDLSHLLITHLNGGAYRTSRILKKSTLEIMHEIQYPNSSLIYGFRYGLGWAMWQDNNNKTILMGHDGDFYGFHSRMHIRTSDNASIIYFYNTDTTPRLLSPRFSSKMIQFGMNRIEELLFEKADSL